MELSFSLVVVAILVVIVLVVIIALKSHAPAPKCPPYPVEKVCPTCKTCPPEKVCPTCPPEKVCPECPACGSPYDIFPKAPIGADASFVTFYHPNGMIRVDPASLALPPGDTSRGVVFPNEGFIWVPPNMSLVAHDVENGYKTIWMVPSEPSGRMMSIRAIREWASSPASLWRLSRQTLAIPSAPPEQPAGILATAASQSLGPTISPAVMRAIPA